MPPLKRKTIGEFLKFLPPPIKNFLRPFKEGMCNVTEFFRFHYCLKTNKPYFGAMLSSDRGTDIRYQHMRRLVKQECLHKAKPFYKILEIGSWAGGSAIVLAEAIKKHNEGRGVVVCVDPWVPYIGNNRGGCYRVMERAIRTGKIINLFLHNVKASGFEEMVVPLKGRSSDVLPLLKPNQFDLIYVDGDHAYQQVLQDIQNSSSLLFEEGILCGDDLELQLPDGDLEYLKANSHLDCIVNPRDQTYYHPGVTLAVGEAFGDVSCWDGFWAMRKVSDRWEQVILDTGN